MTMNTEKTQRAKGVGCIHLFGLVWPIVILVRGVACRYKRSRKIKECRSQPTTPPKEIEEPLSDHRMVLGIELLAERLGKNKVVPPVLTQQQIERIRSSVVLSRLAEAHPSQSVHQLACLLVEHSSCSQSAIDRMRALWEHPSLSDTSIQACSSGGSHLSDAQDLATNRLIHSSVGYASWILAGDSVTCPNS